MKTLEQATVIARLENDDDLLDRRIKELRNDAGHKRRSATVADNLADKLERDRLAVKQKLVLARVEAEGKR